MIFSEARKVNRVVVGVMSLVLGVLVSSTAALGQESHEDAIQALTATFEPAQAKPGETVTLRVNLVLNQGWYTYPIVQADSQVSSKSKFTTPKSDELVFVGGIIDPPNPKEKSVPDLGWDRVQYYPGQATWELKAVVLPTAEAGQLRVSVSPRPLICLDQAGKELCLPPKPLPVEASLTITDGPAQPVAAEYKEAVDEALKEAEKAVSESGSPPATDTEPGTPSTPTEVADVAPEPHRTIVPPVATIEQHREDLETVLAQLPPQDQRSSAPVTSSLWGFIGIAILWGLISLVTPCVFPMIPITVSFFLKSGDQSSRRTAIQAGVYCGTIILVLGISAFTLLSVFRALSVDPYMNIFLGALFVFFALSLFGMYEITLPSGLSRFTSGKQSQGGMLGTIFMALTFTIISFTCVAPFLGGFSGMAASGNFTTAELAVGGFAFSTAFAAPFFVLAMFPRLLKQVPKSGGWLNAVKVVMGFLELAAALKFFRTAELRLLPSTEFFTYDMVLGLWIAIALLCSFYLLNFYRLPHDSIQETIGVTRMLFALMFIGVAIYFLPAMFRGGPENERIRPAGKLYAWADAFLLPEPEDLGWSVNLKGTLDRARELRMQNPGEPQYVFVDFTGVTCTNCKLNERNIFELPTVQPLLERYHLVQMYTDEVPKDFYTEFSPTDDRRTEEGIDLNLSFQKEAFGTEQLPLYVILEPVRIDGEDKINVLGIYAEGLINDVESFTQFLKVPFEQTR